MSFLVLAEEEITPNGNTRKIHYLSGAVCIQTTTPSGQTVESFYYTYADYLGSLIALANENGTVAEKYAYDPWGRRRNPADWTEADGRTSWILNRGFTGHEHIQPFATFSCAGIIDMNGRIYDPLTAQFFSPDPYIQAPDNWVNYNRYLYAFGNPLKYTDPDGEYALLDDLGAALIGGIINVISNGGSIRSVGQGLSLFGVGFVGGWVSLYATPVVGGAIIGAGNSWVNQGFGGDGKWDSSKVDGSQIAIGASMGALTSAIGGPLGDKIGKGIAPLTDKIVSPVLKETINRTISNVTVGFTLGAGFSLINGDKLGPALQNGAKGALLGLATGTVSGLYSGFKYARSHDMSPWTGKSNVTETNNNYSVYKGTNVDTGEVEYVGITKRDPEVRWNEHKSSETERANLEYRTVKNGTGLTKTDARVMEQNLINQYQMKINGGQLYNQRNSIAPQYWDKFNVKSSGFNIKFK